MHTHREQHRVLAQRGKWGRDACARVHVRSASHGNRATGEKSITVHQEQHADLARRPRLHWFAVHRVQREPRLQ